MYKYIIIDDEKLSVGMLRNHLDVNSNFEFIGEFDASFKALDVIKSGEVDVVFISFLANGENVMDFIGSVNSDVLPLFVVMSENQTNSSKIKAALNVIDFIEKPFNVERFSHTLRRIDYEMALRVPDTVIETKSGRDYIFIKVDKKRIKLSYSDVLYLESVKDYVKVVTTKTKESYLVYSTLTRFTADLPSDLFMRVHRSFTISIRKVESIEGNSIDIAGKKIPFSRKYLEEIRNKLFIDGE
ncbi:MAG: response regulator transcription factor [Bacteroidales bacterium]|nr:response regulator transcription factor [Bacteroidales bacterium]